MTLSQTLDHMYSRAKNIPESRGNGLSQTEVRVLKERKRELVILADRDKRSGSIETVRQQEESE